LLFTSEIYISFILMNTANVKDAPAGARPSGGSRYSAPALEKGLDILELLAGRSEPMTQTGIAAELGRSVSELFRMLACLERRGYVARPSLGEGYVLTMRLHELANLYPPTRRLLDVALPAIRALAERTRQSCHLGVYSAGQLYVVAQVESPAPVGFSVRLATGFPLLGTASGRVLLAFQPGEVRRAWLGPAADEHAPRLDTIRDLGFERIAGETFRGITDLSRPVLDQRGHALAALTVPYAEMSGAHASLDETAGLLAETAAAISAGVGGRASG
jgi:DNA-binding IclR family transcriptional regulator